MSHLKAKLHVVCIRGTNVKKNATKKIGEGLLEKCEKSTLQRSMNPVPTVILKNF